MKNILMPFALILVVVFILSVTNTFHSISKLTLAEVTLDSNLLAFDPALNEVTGFKEIESRMSGMIKGYKQTEHAATLWNIILNLLVTILSGLTALIASISTIKNNAVSKAAGIRIAIITFITALLSFGQSQITNYREDAQKSKEKVMTIRDEMEALKAEELNALLPKYNRRLDEEFN